VAQRRLTQLEEEGQLLDAPLRLLEQRGGEQRDGELCRKRGEERNSKSAGGNIERVSRIPVWNTSNSGINSHAIFDALQ